MGQSVYTRIIRGLPQLPVLFKYVFAIWTVINVFFVWRYWDMPNHDDALAYEQLALGCIEADTYYPAQHNLYDPFTFGPGYVNLLIGLHTLTGSIHSVRLLNLIMNCLVVIGILLLGKRLFNKETGFLAAILYMCIYSNAYVPIAMLTDLPFTFLGLAAILFCTSKRVFPIFIAGMCLATANWIRPLAIVFLSTILFYFLADKRNWTHFAALLLSFFLIVLLIGTKAKERTGYFLYQAVSGGYNLAMSSFDEANGLVNFNGFGDSKNYIYLGPEPYTFIERDSLLKAASIKWITENPKQYLSQFPLKLAALYCEDTWSERVKPDMGFRTVLENMGNDKKAFVQLAASLVLKSAVYYVVLFLFLCYLWFNRKSFLSKRNIFLLIPFLGTAVTLIFVITSRYHYPYLFMITIYAASALIELVNNRRNQGSAKFELSYNKTL